MVTTTAINRSSIEAMLAKVREVSAKAEVASHSPSPVDGAAGSFGAVLKDSLEKVSSMQGHAEKLSQAFAKGDNTVSISDMMIAGQKANIAFQATVQVRNKLVSGYQEIMSMAV